MEDDDDDFEKHVARLKGRRETARDAMREAFRRSPAVLVTRGSDEELWIASPELDPKEGTVRITTLRHDGPWGHTSGKDMEELVEKEASSRVTYTPVDDDFVMTFTGTTEYREGIRRLAFVQADNQLRWIAGQKGRDASTWASDLSYRVIMEAEETGDLEGATRTLERAAADVQAGRAPNPGIRALKARLLAR